MEPVNLVRQLSELIKRHGVSYHIEDEWVVPLGKLPAIRATWYPREHNGRLEVDVLLDNGVLINECFGGFGDGDDGVRDALENFCVNSLHVFLAAFWGKNDPEQVTTETWEIGANRYTVYIGNFGTRGSAEVSPDVPGGLFESIERTIKNEPLDGQYYWIRHFFCDVKGDQTFEALLNNKVWESGLQNLKLMHWKKSDGYYSVRNFMILCAAA